MLSLPPHAPSEMDLGPSDVRAIEGRCHCLQDASNRHTAAHQTTQEKLERPTAEEAATREAAEQFCEWHVTSLVATSLEWLGFTPAARGQIESDLGNDLLKLLQLSGDEVERLTALDEFDKAGLKRWQTAAAALAEGGRQDHQLLARCSVQYALYTYLAGQVLEVGGADIAPGDVDVLPVRLRCRIQCATV